MVFSNEACSTFTAMNSRTLLSDHVSKDPRKATVTHVWEWLYLESKCEVIVEFKKKIGRNGIMCMKEKEVG